jgi:GDP-4-dehydro-6-deoxy-D-mannose reductase
MSAARVLITGATGFVGSHLIEFLLKEGIQSVYGAKRRRSDMSFVEHLRDKLEWVEMDVTDAHNVLAVVKEIKPTHIFHLAAQSFVPTSWKAPQETFMTNAIGTVNVLEAVRTVGIDAKIHIAGSSEEYGYVRLEELPITESNPLRPLSPYGVSKVAADLFGQQYHRSFGLHVVITRAFNHTGPRRGEMFVTSSFSKQIVEIEMGLRDPIIYVGNLEAKRDFTDVRDVVRAYWLALEKCNPGEVYNICSGKAISMRDLLEKLLVLSEVRDIKIERDPTRMRPSDVPLLLGDYSKFNRETGWEPEIPFEKTLKDILEYWRQKLVGHK